MADRIEARFLGPVRIERDGLVVRGFESRKALGLLAYLAVRGVAATREHLADLLWPDLPETRGRANLSGALHSLTRLLPGCLAADRHTVELRHGPEVWLDTEAFAQYAARGSAEARAAAIHLYRDDFVSDIYLDDCPEFELWLVRQREEWRARVTQLLASLVEYHASRAEYTEALRFGAQLLEIEPWREEAHRQLMALFAAGGQRSAALAQYDTCRKALAEELGVPPAAETVALYEEIRTGQVEGGRRPVHLAPAVPPHNLPAEVTSFVGREAELEAVVQRLDNPACRLLTLVGPGGVGKTRLALRAADRRLGAFPEGVFLVRLRALAAADDIVTAMAATLDVAPSEGTDLKSDVLEHLRPRQVLLVMDTFEHVLPGVGFLVELLRAAPALKVLATSRERLNLQAEWVMPLDGLEYAEDDSPEAVRGASATQLFVARARQVVAGFTLDEDTAGGVARICRAVAGLPLAIELAATHVDELSCLSIAQEIGRSLDALATTMQDVPARHRSLRAVIDQSWARLPADEQRAFARLGVFRGGFHADAAGAVAAVRPAVLAALRARCLIRGELSGRYDLHPLLWHFANEKLQLDGTSMITEAAASSQTGPLPPASDGMTFDVHRRHAEYFLTLAEAAEAQFTGPDLTRALSQLRQEHDNLRAALQWAQAAGDSQLGLRLSGALARFWQLQGYFAEGQGWLQSFLALPGAAVTAERAKALAGAGALAVEQGDLESAQSYYEASLAMSRQLGDRRGSAAALNKLGNIANFRGDAGTARALYDESLTLARDTGDTWATAAALNNLGNVANFQGDYDEARRLYRVSLDAFRAVGDRWAVSVTLNNLGLIASEQGDLDAATVLLGESLALARELGDRQGVAYALQNAGDVAVRQGDATAARALLGESLLIRREIGDHQGVAWSLESLASLAKADGEGERAVCLLAAAAALRETIGTPRQANERAEQQAELAALRSALGAGAYAAAWDAGRALSEDDATDLALQPGPWRGPSQGFAKSRPS